MANMTLLSHILWQTSSVMTLMGMVGGIFTLPPSLMIMGMVCFLNTSSIKPSTSPPKYAWFVFFMEYSPQPITISKTSNQVDDMSIHCVQILYTHILCALTCTYMSQPKCAHQPSTMRTCLLICMYLSGLPICRHVHISSCRQHIYMYIHVYTCQPSYKMCTWCLPKLTIKPMYTNVHISAII